MYFQIIVLQKVPTLINDGGLGVTQYDPRMRVQCLYTYLEKVWRTDVIVCSPLKILGLCQFQHTVVIPTTAKVLRTPVKPNSAIQACVFTTNSLRIVSGRVVRNDKFEVPKGLGKYCFQTEPQEAFTVVYRHSDAYTRAD